MITVSQLKRLCEEQIKKGNGDKEIIFPYDDECNGLNALDVGFTTIEEFGGLSPHIDLPKDKDYLESHAIILG